MKQLTFIIIFIITFNIVSAQEQIFFNKNYFSDTVSVSGILSVELEESYFLLGRFFQDENLGFSLRKLNDIGEIQSLVLLPIDADDVLLGRGSSFIKTADGNYAVVGTGTLDDTPNEKAIYAIKFDLSGQEIWSHKYDDGLYSGGVTIINTQEGGYLVTGFTQDIDPTVEAAQAYMIKLNSSGEVEWEQTHSENTSVFDVIQTTEGNYLLSGYQNNSPATSYDPWLLLTDPLGNQIWEKTYGTDESDVAAFIAQSSSNSIIIGTSKHSNSSSINNKMYIINIDMEGEVIWEKDFTYEENTYCATSPIINEKKEIILVCQYSNDFSSIAPPRQRLMKLDSLGNILIDQPIEANIYGSQYIRDLDACEDGGYLLTGFINNAQGGSWVVKTDSLGQTCYQVSCDSIAYAPSISSLIVKDRPITISPNPAQDQAIIAYDLGDFKSAALHLYDSQGRLVQVQSLDIGAAFTSINLSCLISGLYVYEVVVDGKQIHSSSLVIK